MTENHAAVQILTERGLIRRMAWCPEHGNRTSAFVGVQGSLLGEEPKWLFRCLTRDHPPHPFVVDPDPHAPKTAEETDKWVAAQKASMAAGKVRKQGA